jgi:hypothetical protein
MKLKRPKLFEFKRVKDELPLTEFVVRPQDPILFVPIRENAFKVTLPSEWNIPDYLVFSINKPKISIDISNGNTEWDVIQLKLYDTINHNISLTVKELLDGLTNILTDCNIIIEQLDPTGEIIEKWDIIGMIVGVDFGDLDYRSDNISNITLYIQPFNCDIIHPNE